MTESAPPSASRRNAGVLLHPAALSGGCLGNAALEFIDWLADRGFEVWQTLPLVPTDGYGSPYSSRAANAGNIELIDVSQLVSAGLLDAKSDGSRAQMLAAAWETFRTDADHDQRSRFDTFVETEASWLKDFGMFEVLRDRNEQRPWWQWPEAERDRRRERLSDLQTEMEPRLLSVYFGQYIFASQWQAVRAAARRRGVKLFGDMPLYVAGDSVDVWANRDLFDLLPDGTARRVAGVPPDYFSVTGQRWGNPLYRWEKMQEDDFAWWQARVSRQAALFDILRIDHFRGLEAYWSIDAAEETAVHGEWVKAPGAALLSVLTRAHPDLEFIAEDLGVITDEVRAIKDGFQLAGMKVLQFAFDGSPDNPFLPWNIEENSVVYTGTHDNETTAGWRDSLSPEARAGVVAALSIDPDADIAAALVDTALDCRSRLAILPMQDILGLGAEYRTNTPGTEQGNWRFELDWDGFDKQTTAHWRQRLASAGRLNET